MLDINKIKEMLSQGRVNDLLDLLEGESKYTGESVKNMAKTEDEKVARSYALTHLRFLSKFGESREKVVEGHMVHSARAKEFIAWLDMGAPGIEPNEFNNYLNDNPLKSK